MKIIFSKKGFDDTNGKVPSPVFDEKGTKFISMPIPAVKNGCDKIPYSEIEYHGHNLGELVEKLKGKKVIELEPLIEGGKKRTKTEKLTRISLCHFDPQLVQNEKDDKSKNWKPLFGQASSTQGHLANQKVKEEALFLFFGHFRQIDENKEEKIFTAIYGWLQVEECIDLKNISEEDKAKLKKDKPYIVEHPHFKWQPNTENNTIYTGKDFLDIGQTNTETKGAGLFDRLYILTEEKKGAETNAENRNLDKLEFLSKTNWILPKCLSPLDDSKVTLTYNSKFDEKTGLEKDNWRKNVNDKNTCKLRVPQTFAQEFVLNYDNADQKTKKDIETWVKNLFA